MALLEVVEHLEAGGRSGSVWPGERTSTTGPLDARATMPATRRTSVEPCQAKVALERPSARIGPRRGRTPPVQGGSTVQVPTATPGVTAVAAQPASCGSPGSGDLVCELLGDREGFGKGHPGASREVASHGRRRTLGCVCSDSGESEQRLDVLVCDGRRAQRRRVPVEPTAGVECHGAERSDRPSVPSSARVVRLPLAMDKSPERRAAGGGATPGPLRLVGAWAEGRALVGSDPLVVVEGCAGPVRRSSTRSPRSQVACRAPPAEAGSVTRLRPRTADRELPASATAGPCPYRASVLAFYDHLLPVTDRASGGSRRSGRDEQCERLEARLSLWRRRVGRARTEPGGSSAGHSPVPAT